MKKLLCFWAENFSKLVIFFDKRVYEPDFTHLREMSLGDQFRGSCSGYNLEFLDKGKVVFYFNPLQHGLHQRLQIRRNVVDYIKSTKWEPEKKKRSYFSLHRAKAPFAKEP